jgi:starvation-inducible DNA-binding protein
MNPGLVNSTAQNLSNLVVFSFKAQGHHWNVKGMKFYMFHDFFGEIYEEAQSAIDPMAENLLKLGSNAPYKLVDFARLSTLEDSECSDVYSMLKDLYMSNEEVLSSLNECYELADECREYGLADFLGQRIDIHKKHAWMLKAHMEEKSY